MRSKRPRWIEERDFKRESVTFRDNCTISEAEGNESFLSSSSPPLSLSLEENIPSSVTMGKFAAS